MLRILYKLGNYEEYEIGKYEKLGHFTSHLSQSEKVTFVTKLGDQVKLVDIHYNNLIM